MNVGRRFVQRGLSPVLFCLFSLLTAVSVHAQAGAGAPTLTLLQPYAGDCSVTVMLSEDIKPGDVRVYINTRPVRIEILQQAPLVGLLQDPLALNADVSATAGGVETGIVRVAPPPPGQTVRTACAAAPNAPKPRVIDERSTFEAAGYLGMVFDNFAPNEVGAYANDTKGDTRSRMTAGVEAQYRIFGSETTSRQLWISSQTLHGMRTADVNCEKTPEAAVCRKTASTSDKFLFILEHASTMEAHIDARFEFATLQMSADTPVRTYVVSSFGFVAMESGPKVFNSDTYAGVGILSPRGTFKGSFAQVGWGHSEQFQSFPDANRLKILGTLAFDLVPSLAAGASGFFGRLGGGSRAFIAIAVDRDPSGPAPDAVQTYVGFDFDLRKMFGSER